MILINYNPGDECNNVLYTPLFLLQKSSGYLSNSKLFLYSPNIESLILENGHNFARAFPYQELNNGGVRR